MLFSASLMLMILADKDTCLGILGPPAGNGAVLAQNLEKERFGKFRIPKSIPLFHVSPEAVHVDEEPA